MAVRLLGAERCSVKLRQARRFRMLQGRCALYVSCGGYIPVTVRLGLVCTHERGAPGLPGRGAAAAAPAGASRGTAAAAGARGAVTEARNAYAASASARDFGGLKMSARLSNGAAPAQQPCRGASSLPIEIFSHMAAKWGRARWPACLLMRLPRLLAASFYPMQAPGLTQCSATHAGEAEKGMQGEGCLPAGLSAAAPVHAPRLAAEAGYSRAAPKAAGSPARPAAAVPGPPGRVSSWPGAAAWPGAPSTMAGRRGVRAGDERASTGAMPSSISASPTAAELRRRQPPPPPAAALAGTAPPPTAPAPRPS